MTALREIVRTCSNVHVARAALASIGGEFAAAIRRRRFAPRPAERRARRAAWCAPSRSMPPTTSDGRSRRLRAAPISPSSSACVTFSPGASAPGGPQPPTRLRTRRPPGRFAPPATPSGAISGSPEATLSLIFRPHRVSGRLEGRRDRRAVAERVGRGRPLIAPASSRPLVERVDFRDSRTMIAIGVDCGTSGLKAVLVEAGGGLIAAATRAYRPDRPRPLWSEQDPEVVGRGDVRRARRAQERRARGLRRDRRDRFLRPDARRGAHRPRRQAAEAGDPPQRRARPPRGGRTVGTPSSARRRRRRQADGRVRRAEADLARAP